MLVIFPHHSPPGRPWVQDEFSWHTLVQFDFLLIQLQEPGLQIQSARSSIALVLWHSRPGYSTVGQGVRCMTSCAI